MNSRRQVWIALGLAVSVSLIAAAVAAGLVSYHDSRASFDLVNAICCEVIEQEPGTRKIVSAALKEYTEGNQDGLLDEPLLSFLGYQASDFSDFRSERIACFAAAGWIVGLSLFLLTFLYRNNVEKRRIRGLTEYLEQVNSGKAVLLSTVGEDAFSKLEDEIYKTVTSLYQTRDQAVQAKKAFAENLSNIAHQIKTPITALSLTSQRMRQDFRHPALAQVEKQLSHLTYLEDSLLVLSRLDAGALVFQKEKTDVFTLLVLAADHLQELFSGSGASVEIPEQGERMILADMDWTMEAIMNLMKNCIEHDPGGAVHCSYAQNPLYTEIRIWDDGEGFAKEDLPHLFERFYRGQNAREGGIGIGLAIAKEIIERQNGTIRAQNGPEGGAFFEIRFYGH